MTGKEKAFKIMKQYMWGLGDWLGRALDPKNPKDDLDGPKCRAAVLRDGYVGLQRTFYTWRIIKRFECENMGGFEMEMYVKFKVRPK